MNWINKTLQTGLVVAALGSVSQYAIAASGDWEWYGQVNKGVHRVDDGKETYVSVADSDASSTRVGVHGSTTHHNVNIGGTAEIEYESASNSTISQREVVPAFTHGGASGNAHASNINVRVAEAWVKDCWGKFSVGRGHMASNETAESSFAGVDMVTTSDVGRMAGQFRFHNKALTGNAAVADAFVAQVFTMKDGHGRRDRFRYDTPEWNGLQASASIGSRDWPAATAGGSGTVGGGGMRRQYLSDVALRYHHEFSDFALKAAAAYAKRSKNGASVDPTLTIRGQDIWDGSIAAIHNSTGINGAVAFSKEKDAISVNKSERAYYVQVGKKNDFWHHGKTNFAIDYYQGKNFNEVNALNVIPGGGANVASTNQMKSKSWGVTIVQELDRWNSEMYGAYRHYDLKTPVAENQYDNLWAVMLGVRVRFSA